MWTSELFGFTFFQLFYYFMLYSFLGWAMESAFVSITTKEWVNRGFINGPLCPIYGTGALLILVLLSPVKSAASVLRRFSGGNGGGIRHCGAAGKTLSCFLVGLQQEKV